MILAICSSNNSKSKEAVELLRFAEYAKQGIENLFIADEIDSIIHCKKVDILYDLGIYYPKNAELTLFGLYSNVSNADIFSSNYTNLEGSSNNYCTHCGAIRVQLNHFCGNCGTKYP